MATDLYNIFNLPPGYSKAPGTNMIRNDATGEVMSFESYHNMVREQGTTAPLTPALQRDLGYNPDGSPIAKDRDSLLDPATGLLKQAYQYQGKTIDPNTLEGMSAIKADALRSGPSKWLTLAEQKQQAEQAQANDAANSNAMAGNAQARSTLAMRGGLSAGARERLGSQMQKDIIGARQNVAGQGILARAKLALDDEGMRRDSLNTFAGAEGKLASYNNDIGNNSSQFNILQALQEKSRGDEDSREKWKQQMEKWAANRQADATASSGGGGK